MGAIKLCDLSSKINKILQRMKAMFKPEQTYDEWLRATNLYRQGHLTDSVEIIHNYLNEKKEKDSVTYFDVKKSDSNASINDLCTSETLPVPSCQLLKTSIQNGDEVSKVRMVGKFVEWSV